VCSSDNVCKAVVRVPRCLCVSMVLTEVDNCSNDCGGGGGGSGVSGTGRRQCRAAWLDVSQLLCLCITCAQGVDRSIPHKIKVQGSFLV